MITLKPICTLDDNSKYEFIVDKKYIVKVIIDEFGDNRLVLSNEEGYEYTCCTCPDFIYRKRICKHIKDVITFLKSMEVEINELPN